MNKRNIQIASPCIGEEEWQALKDPLATGWLTQGPKVADFENAFAIHHRVKHAIATTSCTTALHLALLAVGVKPGDGVVVPSFTWIATANAVEYCGAVPVFCDIDPKTYNICVDSAREQILKSIKQGLNISAIVPVHLFGLFSDMYKVRDLASNFNLKIVEDAACAAGADYHGHFSGSLGDVGCYSFHPRKILVTGEGGMCTTNHDELAAQINSLRNHGASVSEEQRHSGNAPYLLPEFKVLGYNYRMTDLQGALGLVQLSRLEAFIMERENWARYYDCELKNIEWLKVPSRPEGCRISWQSYVSTIDETISPMTRNDLMKYLQARGISTRPGTQAVHTLDYYKTKYDLHDEDFPNAYNAAKTSIALPLHNCMKPDDYEYIVNVLRSL